MAFFASFDLFLKEPTINLPPFFITFRTKEMVCFSSDFFGTRIEAAHTFGIRSVSFEKK